jgi:hypothetical protein
MHKRIMSSSSWSNTFTKVLRNFALMEYNFQWSIIMQDEKKCTDLSSPDNYKPSWSSHRGKGSRILSLWQWTWNVQFTDILNTLILQNSMQSFGSSYSNIVTIDMSKGFKSCLIIKHNLNMSWNSCSHKNSDQVQALFVVLCHFLK